MMRTSTPTTNNTKNILGAFTAATEFFGFEDIPALKEPVVDDNDVNKVIILLESGTLGNEKDYREELNMARYLEKVERITPIKSVSKKLVAYSSFLYVDGLAKYVLEQVEKIGYLSSEVRQAYKEKVRDLNEYVRTQGPLKVWEECEDAYWEICNEVIILAGKEAIGWEY